MKSSVATLDRIAQAAVDQLLIDGAASLTVAAVAGRAGISSALVHYHYDSKQGLLRAATERLAAARLERRAGPLAGSGLDAIDALRLALEAEAATGGERAWHDLLHLGRADPPLLATLDRYRERERHVLAERLPALLASLGSAPAVAPEQLAVVVQAALDGFGLAWATGVRREAVRSAYDAFWLVVIRAGQSAR
jgi:AcrR family transcriptional regulator